MITSSVSNHVVQITDGRGVNLTLVMGMRSALLIDTGYGLEPIRPVLDSLTTLPVQIVLTHAHHDHALGCMQFENVLAFPEEQAVYEHYTCRERRLKVLSAAGLQAESYEAYLNSQMPPLSTLEEDRFDLGEIHVQTVKVPGHTPGSAMFLVEEERLLITGDNWNPETWLFFPEALPLHIYKQNMNTVMSLPFDKVLCSHHRGVYPRCVLDDFLSHIRSDASYSRMPFPDLPQIEAMRMVLPEDQVIVFDREKCQFDRL
ncbi:MAG: MBL fold metallo-hydrolase [Clostridia bacterium]|nr:MBL fold metallo-hydrolase [Clostridia bacterium]